MISRKGLIWASRPTPGTVPSGRCVCELIDTELGLVHSFVFALAVLSMHVCVWCVSLEQRQLGQSVQQV